MRFQPKITAFLFFLCCYVMALGRTPTDSLMNRLEDAIANRHSSLEKKEAILQQNHDKVRLASTDTEKFDALLHLFDEYHSFNSDSTYNISCRLILLAQKIGASDLIEHARMKRASILMATGMYLEAQETMDSIKNAYLPEYLRPYYFHLQRTLYGSMADYAAFGPEKLNYEKLTNSYRDSILSVNDINSLGYVLTKADYYNHNGSPNKAADLLTGYMSVNGLSEHERAICAYTLSDSYKRLGQKDKQKEQLLISAIDDMRSATREYLSLRELALLLYEEGDLDHAYEFMSITLDDASKCNSRQRIIELNDAFPKINEIYIETIQSQKNSLARTIWAITLLLLLLIAMLFIMRRQMLKTRQAKQELETAYGKLNAASEQLKVTNDNLNKANNDIAEISQLKEVYICQYMDQCVEYIDKLDSYRKSIGKLVSYGKTKEVERMVKSTSMVDEELKAFYNQFDKTFLNLFPTFIEDFNALLMPDEAIYPKREGTLNTELRIFALIRLGITDSDRIAKFLRCSVATIYTYRTRVRNKAAGDRNMLEQKTAKIGHRQG